MPQALTAALAALASASVVAQSPVGLWCTIDENTGKERSLVRITESGGVLTGKIEKILEPTKQDAKCDACADERKGQPVLGMTIIRNVKKAKAGSGKAARSSIRTTAWSTACA